MKPCHYRLPIVILCLLFPFLISNLRSVMAQEGRPDQNIRFLLLDNANCDYTASHRGSWATVGGPFERRQMPPIINRQLETSIFHIRAPRQQYTTLVCNINTDDFDTLTLRMGVADESGARNEQMTVNVYQGDDNIIASRQNAEPGAVMHLSIDLSNTPYGNPGNIAIELLCDRSSYSPGCILYFLEAELTGEKVFSGSGGATSPQRHENSSSTSSDSSNDRDETAVDRVIDAAVDEAVEGVEKVIEGLF